MPPAQRAPSARMRASSSSAALRLRRAAKAARHRGGPPSAALIWVPPFALCAGVVGVAAAHNALGSPLGPAWAAEVWSLAKTAITAMLAIAGAGSYIHLNNRRAWAASELAPPSAPPPMVGPGEDGPPPAHQRTGPGSRAAHSTSESVRARRTGKLTPVESLIPDEDLGDASISADERPTSRQAGGRWGGGGTR